MPFFKRNGLTIACLLLALLCYAIGFPAGSGGFIILGALLEVFFWLRVLRVNRKE